MLVLALLTAFFVLAVTATLDKCTTYDEVAHLTAGYSFWRFNDYRFQGNWPQRWAALPLLWSEPNFPSQQASWYKGHVWDTGMIFFYSSQNNPDRMLLQGRIMMGLLSVVLGALVFCYARRLFGTLAGFLSLTLFVICPTLLANGPLITADTATSLFFLASLPALWWVLHEITPGSLIVGGLVLGGLFLSKYSAVIIVPVAGLLVLLRLADGRPLPVRCGPAQWTVLAGGLSGRLRHLVCIALSILAAFLLHERAFRLLQKDLPRDADLHAISVLVYVFVFAAGYPVWCWLLGRLYFLAAFAAAAAVQTVIIAALIWVSFGCRYAILNDPVPGQDQLRQSWETVFAAFNFPETTGNVIRWARDWRLLPEAYLYWFAYTLRVSMQRESFLNGQWSETGFPSFFPYSFAVKTPLGILAVLLLALLSIRVLWNFRAWRETWRTFYLTAPLWVFLAVYWLFAVTSHIHIGHRHVLPTYPVMFVLAGAAAGFWSSWPFFRKEAAGSVADASGSSKSVADASGSDKRYPVQASILCGLLTLAALGWAAAESLRTWPNYLAYFNQIAGGPRNGYRHLVDSSLDWGQDLPGLKKWLEKNDKGKEHIYVAYFGNGNLPAYGITAHAQPPPTGFPDDPYLHPELDAPLAAATLGLLGAPFGQGPLLAATARANPRLVPELLHPGIYCISATYLQGVDEKVPFHGPWTERFERQYQKNMEFRWFYDQRGDPDANELLSRFAEHDAQTRSKKDRWRAEFAATYHELRFARLVKFLRRSASQSTT